MSKEVFRYLRCTACGLIFLDNVPPDLGRYYVADYHSIPADGDALERAAAAETHKIDLVTRYATTGSLLDIGASYGAFCHLAINAGFETAAIEADEGCCAFMREHLSIDVAQAFDVAAELRRGKRHDVITLWHVLEHLERPWDVIDAIGSALTPSGKVVIAVPNPSALQAKIMGTMWPHIDAPRHLFQFSLDWLKRRAQGAGLDLVDVTFTEAGGTGWNRFGWSQWLSNPFKGRYVRYAARKAGGSIATLVAPFETKGQRGATYTAIFAKADQ
ncbi:MAG: class I SAM-dependent methyltransferase [Actinomycetota bacterium]|nr:class I SAM-dependent methyltransferase [Actinomycetota bacterium]